MPVSFLFQDFRGDKLRTDEPGINMIIDTQNHKIFGY